jgi:DNA-binding NarL/FixJ family response regulator
MPERSEVTRAAASAAAFTELSTADSAGGLDAAGLERLAITAYLVGHDDAGDDAWARAFHRNRTAGEPARAARCAFWLSLHLLNRGEIARGNGWLATGQQTLDEVGRDCVEHGYLRLPVALQCLATGDTGTAVTACGDAVAAADRFGDPDLRAIAGMARGHALIRLGATADGLTSLDAAMVAVTAGEVSTIVTGIVYCGVIVACREAFDPRRAQEWTRELARWCAARPDLMLFRGQCRVHRSEIMQLRGEWSDAVEELLEPQGPPDVRAMAHYRLGELHRLRGEHGAAEEAYRRAGALGRRPQPGLALLWLACGRVDAAAAAIRTALDGPSHRAERAALLAAYVDIALTAGDLGAARSAVDELAGIAAAVGAPALTAEAGRATGAVLRAEGRSREALAVLREALAAWAAIEAPYEVALTRVPLAFTCRDLGDEATADLELDAARAAFAGLGAAPDVARVDAARGRAARLSPREREVLRLVAAGHSNQAVATELFLSERTVERHVSNILAKLDVGSRTAAAAYAFEHGIS